MIKFKHDALVKEYKRVNFPKTMFRFKSFEAILSKQEIDEKVLIDIIGRVVQIYSPMEKLIGEKLTRLIDFVLEDISSLVSIGWQSSWHEGVVRYKVIVRVADESGDAPMLIWDRECEELVGLSASDLKAKYPKGNKSIPLELASLRGMSMFFRILMKKDRVESDLQR
nr:replication protein A 70 kDa DNA-binding subunit B-like [Ipomoea batatas]